MVRSGEFHVVVFTDTFFETNGVSSYYRTLLDWCKGDVGMRATLICPYRGDLEMGPYGSNVIPVRASVQFKNPFYGDLTLGYFSQPLLKKVVANLTGPKVVHVATSGALGVAGANVGRKLGVPVVGCYHTDLPHYGRLYGESLLGRRGAWIGEQIALACERFAYSPCGAMCVPSVTAEAGVRRFFRGPTQVISNPVSLGRFRPASSREGAFRKRYGREGRALVVVVGRLAREKNLDLICELLGGDDRIQLVFVGDGPHAPVLKQRWNATVTGFLAGDELLGAFQQADVFVQLSQSETFGLALVEAMACGVPAIVLRSKGFVSTLTGESGVEVLEEDQLAELADRCVALASNGEEHARRSVRSRGFVESISADNVFPRFRAFHRSFVRWPQSAAAPDALLAVPQSV